MRVYVLIYKDMAKLVGLNSLHTKQVLMSKSPTMNNIKVKCTRFHPLDVLHG